MPHNRLVCDKMCVFKKIRVLRGHFWTCWTETISKPFWACRRVWGTHSSAGRYMLIFSGGEIIWNFIHTVFRFIFCNCFSSAFLQFWCLSSIQLRIHWWTIWWVMNDCNVKEHASVIMRVRASQYVLQLLNYDVCPDE